MDDRMIIGFKATVMVLYIVSFKWFGGLCFNKNLTLPAL